MAFWKVPVKKIEYSFVIIESEFSEPTDSDIENAASELNEDDWTDTEYEAEEEPFEVDESFACEYDVYVI